MKALIAMSGGVDSAVAACLMQQKGYDCVGCTMKLYHNEDLGISRAHTCCALDDAEERAVLPIAWGCRIMCSFFRIPSARR